MSCLVGTVCFMEMVKAEERSGGLFGPAVAGRAGGLVGQHTTGTWTARGRLPMPMPASNMRGSPQQECDT